MTPGRDPLPSPLDAAARRVKQAARVACERAVESLGLALLSTSQPPLRDLLREAQGELARRTALFALTFDETLDKRVLQDIRAGEFSSSTSGVSLDWEALSLVGNDEMEVKVAAERLGFDLGRGCEWELREFEGFLGPLFQALGAPRTDHDRNPLRPENIGMALVRAAAVVSERPEVRKQIESEMARSMAATMARTYTEAVAELRAAGLKPAGLSVRVSETAAPVPPPAATAAREQAADAKQADDNGPASTQGAWVSSQRGALAAATPRRGSTMGRVGAQMMSLMRQLTTRQRAEPGDAPSRQGGVVGPGGSLPDGAGPGQEAYRSAEGLPMVARNEIRAHREALQQATTGALDHMVIDVVGSLFDQILSDPKVPPQMARQIGRLQLPVLRAALGDPSFFSSRKHPVRRFVNRLASMATAFDGLDDAGGQQLLELVQDLVQQIVDGDFEQLEVYEQKLAVLEKFVAAQAGRELHDSGDPASLLAAKEGELQLRHRYAQRLQRELLALQTPDFVRDFLAQVWSRVLLQVVSMDGADTTRLDRLRHAGRDLFMSVQPKGSSIQRKAFLAQLPRLMASLNEGMDLVGWPEAERKAFFAVLLPAHAQSLRGEGLSTLDFNLLARQVDAVFDAPMPRQGDAVAQADLPVLTEELILPAFSAQEARQAGLVDEARFGLGAAAGAAGVGTPGPAEEPSVTAEDLAIDGLPAPDAVEPTQGKALADHVQVGFAYRMHIDETWQKVRLSHVSPARTFFVFTRGSKHPQAISLTQRMLVRLCESGRLRAFESAYLLERATARARKQLSALSAGSASAG